MNPLLTVGEALLRLTPQRHLRLEQASELSFEVAGSELNVAANLARLGHPVRWISKLPRTPLGRKTHTQARAFGIDTTDMVWTDQGRMGLFYFEPAPSPRQTRVWYDRQNSTASTLSIEDHPWEASLQHTRHLHLTGITPALSPNCRALTLWLARMAHHMNLPVSYDLNYRSQLTTREEAHQTFLEIAPHLTTLIIAERDAQQVLGLNLSGSDLALRLQEEHLLQTVAVTCPPQSPHSCVVYHQGHLHFGPHHPVQVVDRLGAGDAFTTGILHGLLTGDLAAGVKLAAYLSALTLCTPGDFSWVTPEDLEALETHTTGTLQR